MPGNVIGVSMDLLSLASCYSKFGDHRSGSDSQLAAEEWLKGILKKLTDNVAVFEYGYQHFEATTELLLNGRPVPSMALYYEAIGAYQDCGNIELAAVEIGDDEQRAYAVIHEKQKQVRQRQCDALVVATRCANDSLYAFNVKPILKNSIPVILVPGHTGWKTRSLVKF